ncbi:uncharacterized protein TNCV_2759691 [Trichonephila clavipes]|nr:uncharacterized protein TNCV_2759691 [Trichonephila clavipes]
MIMRNARAAPIASLSTIQHSTAIYIQSVETYFSQKNLRGLFAKHAKSKSSVEERLMPFLRPQPPIFNGDFTNGVIHQGNFYDSQLLVFEIWSPSSTASPTTFPVVTARISGQSSRHCWRSPLPQASALIQRDFGCVLGVQQTKQLPHVAKVDQVWQLGCNLGQSLSNHGPHVFYRGKIRRASRQGKEFNLVIDEEPLDNACHVWSRIILLKYGCSQALKVRKDKWFQHFRDVALAV